MTSAPSGNAEKGLWQKIDTHVPISNATCYVLPFDMLQHAQLQLQRQAQPSEAEAESDDLGFR